MILEKKRFVTQDIPKIRSSIEDHKRTLGEFLDKEKQLSKKISTSDTFQDLEDIISDMTKAYQRVVLILLISYLTEKKACLF